MVAVVLIALAPGSICYAALSRRTESRITLTAAAGLGGAVTLVLAVMIPAAISTDTRAALSDPITWIIIASLGAVGGIASRRLADEIFGVNVTRRDR